MFKDDRQVCSLEKKNTSVVKGFVAFLYGILRFCGFDGFSIEYQIISWIISYGFLICFICLIKTSNIS